jgi:hypothetical protein
MTSYCSVTTRALEMSLSSGRVYNSVVVIAVAVDDGCAPERLSNLGLQLCINLDLEHSRLIPNRNPNTG